MTRRRFVETKQLVATSGFKLVESDNKKEDNKCEPYIGTCANGELKPQALRRKDNDCGKCDSGYYLENDACKPFSGTCTNGELKPQPLRRKDNDCGSCKGEFWLDGMCAKRGPCAAVKLRWKERNRTTRAIARAESVASQTVNPTSGSTETNAKTKRKRAVGFPNCKSGAEIG